jgi:predicted O-methyltransferase YrrM
MHSPVQLAFKYIKYRMAASNGKGHGIHSPFVFEFVTKVLNGTGDKQVYAEIETVRKQLLQNDTTLSVEDFGAGSRVTGTKQRPVKQIARTSLKPQKYSQLLNRMVAYYQPQTILEIGTSLGLTTCYLAKARPGSPVITMEGAVEIAAVARRNFQKLGISNIEIITGNFDETLTSALSGLQAVDFAFIDGNHRYEPTIRYFEQILKKSNNNTIIVLDDIYWSKEMEQAWEWVKNHGHVRLTIDLFAIGIVVLRPEIIHRQHFCIRY